MHLSMLINTIKVRRETLNVSQEGLAQLSGVSLRTIKQIESGKGNPTLSTIELLADVLGMELKLVIKKPDTK